ncbi:MAG: type IX secretion system protein PorQ [Bacteroidales bacterium]|nr:type IX secretion system protein PorQ [Bacteroidales bacterium]
MNRNGRLRKRWLVWGLVCLLAGGAPVHAQSGGYSFEFLNMTNPARQAALGAEFLSVRDADIQLALANPSLITSEIHNSLSVNYVNYFSGINYGFVSYARHFDKVGNFAFHLQFANYGDITTTNEFGAETGEATANDAAIILGWGRSLDTHFTIGANLKFIGSFIDRYSAVGMAVDVSATYTNTSRMFAVSLLLRNMGGALKTYGGDGGNRMPFEVAVALSQKIPHAPFRFLFEFPNLQKWNLNYDDPFGPVDLVTGERKTRSKAGDFFDDLARHIVIGLELIPYKGFYLRAGYNYDRGQNMSTTGKPGMVGFSWGFGFRVYKFNFSYARSAYHLVGSPNYISLSIDIDAIQKKGFKNMKWYE